MFSRSLISHFGGPENSINSQPPLGQSLALSARLGQDIWLDYMSSQISCPTALVGLAISLESRETPGWERRIDGTELSGAWQKNAEAYTQH